MLISSSDLRGPSELTCDVCIVGSGAAGITLALDLGSRGVDTLCVSGGNLKPRTSDQELYKGYLPNGAAHEPLEANRVRTFGGSTTLWGGRLVPYDRVDFQPRDFVPLSGWPIEYSEVERYAARASELCEVRQKEYETSSANSPTDLPARIGPWVTTNHCERWSMPTDFGRHYKDELRRSQQIRVLLDAHCVDIELDDAHSSVRRVQISAPGQPSRWIAARTFVLACGGLENPRLLLASRRQLPCGIGNDYDMVGRCYMGHIAGTHGFLRLKAEDLPSFYQLTKDDRGMYMRRRFWLTEEGQLENRIMNIIAYPMRPEPGDARHGDPVLSLLRFLNGGAPDFYKATPAGFGRHAWNLVAASPSAWWNAARQFWARFRGTPRLPFVLPYHRRNMDALRFQSEHAPNRESRVVLSNEHDALGMPRLEPRVAFSAVDEETAVRFYAILDRSLREAGLGHVEYSENELRQYLEHIMQNHCSHAHHLGTTRMAADPREGVVDADCRVHGVDNLYIAGSSVFATAGHANPTLLLLALTLRLADRLLAVHGRTGGVFSDVANKQAEDDQRVRPRSGNTLSPAEPVNVGR